MMSGKVKNIAELMSIALQAERQTTLRYSRLAESMRAVGNGSAAALFERMVIEERQHERLLLEWMARESIAEVPDIGPVHWRDPLVATHYDDEARDPHYSTAYKALAFAVNNEDNAFRFYAQVAAEADNASLRECAEALAREELEHADLFRAERRRAYHAERGSNIARSIADPNAIHNEAELLATAIRIDRYFADTLDPLSADSPQLIALAREARQQISKNEGLFRRSFRDLSMNTGQIPDDIITSILPQSDFNHSGDRRDFASGDSGGSKLQQLRICCDRSFVFYDAIVESATNEKIMLAAQTLASVALDRTGALQQFILNQSSAQKI
jgi:rubrerythrin